MTRSTLILFCGWSLAAIAVVHVALLLPDLLTWVPAWADGVLWSMQNLQPFATQPDDMRTAGAAFWAAVGGPGMPLLILALLVVDLAQRGVPIPAFVPALLLIWAVLCSIIMQPSGFPLIVAVSIGILLSRHGATE